MKKTFFLILSVVAVFVLYISSCASEDAVIELPTENSQKVEAIPPPAAPDPTVLNLCDAVVTPTLANTMVPQAYVWIQSNTGTLTPFAIEISGAHLTDLRNVLATKIPTTITNYVTGIRVYFGFVGNSYQLLYRPVYMSFKAAPDTFSVNYTDNYKVYTATGFADASAEQIASLETYTTNVRFKESATNTRTFNPAYTKFGDVRSILMTFQEFNAVMTQNQKDSVVLWNFAAQLPITYGTNRIRQTLLIAPKGLTPASLEEFVKNKSKETLTLVGAFTGNFADRCHLCPPYCDEVCFKVSETGVDNCQQK